MFPNRCFNLKITLIRIGDLLYCKTLISSAKCHVMLEQRFVYGKNIHIFDNGDANFCRIIKLSVNFDT